MERLQSIDRPQGAEVHFWLFGLDKLKGQLPTLRSLLAPEECAREKSILTDEDKDRFVCARGVLRQLLSRYLDMDARLIEISADISNKPHLAPTPGGEDVSFNLSHSGDYIALAFASAGRSVGIDIEVARSLQNVERLAADILSEPEKDAFEKLHGAAQSRYLLSVWTRKEAALKASGSVRSISPADFCAGAGPGRSSVCLAGGERYAVRSHDAAEALHCALALSGPDLEITEISGGPG